MSNCDHQKNKPIGNKRPEIEYSMTTVDTEEPIGDWRLITTAAVTVVGRYFGLRTLGVGQYGALLTSTSLVWFDALYDD